MPSDLLEHCRLQCVLHARSIAEIFHLLNNLDLEVPITESKLAVPAYQCANILSRSVHMNNLPGVFDVHAGLSACFEFTKRLASFNKMAGIIQQDIQRILEHGASPISLSRQQSPEIAEDDCIPTSVMSTDVRRYRFSRHNVVEAAHIEDNSSTLNLRNTIGTLSPHSEETPRTGEAMLTRAPVEQATTVGAELLDPQQTIQASIQQTYASAPDFQIATMNFGEMMEPMDESLNFGEPGGDEIDMDFLFDPLWRIQNQWDTGS